MQGVQIVILFYMTIYYGGGDFELWKGLKFHCVPVQWKQSGVSKRVKPPSAVLVPSLCCSSTRALFAGITAAATKAWKSFTPRAESMETRLITFLAWHSKSCVACSGTQSPPLGSVLFRCLSNSPLHRGWRACVCACTRLRAENLWNMVGRK